MRKKTVLVGCLGLLLCLLAIPVFAQDTSATTLQEDVRAAVQEMITTATAPIIAAQEKQAADIAALREQNTSMNDKLDKLLAMSTPVLPPAPPSAEATPALPPAPGNLAAVDDQSPVQKGGVCTPETCGPAAVTRRGAAASPCMRTGAYTTSTCAPRHKCCISRLFGCRK